MGPGGAPSDYEATVRSALEIHGIERRPTSMSFFKVRNSGVVEWQGGSRRVDHLVDPRDRRAVAEAYVRAVAGTAKEAAALG